MAIKLFYKCNDTNCSNFPYYMIDDFTIITQNFEIHHNESIPIITNDCVKSVKSLLEFDYQCNYASSGQLSLYQRVQMDLEIATIQYKEKKVYQDYLINLLAIKMNISLLILKMIKQTVIIQIHLIKKKKMIIIAMIMKMKLRIMYLMNIRIII